jgi:hypothetical protein
VGAGGPCFRGRDGRPERRENGGVEKTAAHFQRRHLKINQPVSEKSTRFGNKQQLRMGDLECGAYLKKQAFHFKKKKKHT